MIDHNAGSTTGIDLGVKLAKIADDLDTEGLMNTATELRELIALARATPQHSVTEQDERNEAITLLAAVFDAWENGDPCYEDPETSSGFLGMAFRLDDDVFHRCCDLLNRANPPRNAQPLASTAAPQPEQASERDAFEAWAKSQGNRRGRKGDGYSTEYTQRAWLAWQARAALAIPASTAPDKGEKA